MFSRLVLLHRALGSRLAIATAVAAVTLGAALPNVAGAAPTLLTDHYWLSGYLDGGQSLAAVGADTLVGSEEPKGDDVVLAFPPAGPATVIAHVGPIAGGPGIVNVAASPTRLAVFQRGSRSGYKGCCSVSYERVLAGPLSGPLQEQTAGCQRVPGLEGSASGEIGPDAHYAMALDGDLLAYDSLECVVVEDLASGLQRVIHLEATLEPHLGTVIWHEPTVLAVAGRMVAYRANQAGGKGPAAIIVYDIDSGQELYRVPVPGPSSTSATSFALQSDGTLVVSESGDCQASVSTVAEPEPRPLGVPACAVYGLAEGRLLLRTTTEDKHEILGWATLMGSTSHPIADLGLLGDHEAARPVLAGDEVVYALSGCRAPSVYRALLEEPGTPTPPPSSCPISALSGAAVLNSRSLRVRLHCPFGCVGQLRAQVGAPSQARRPNGGRAIVEYEPVSILRGGSATFTLLRNFVGEPSERNLTAKGLLRRLRGGHHLDVRLEMDIETPAYGRGNEREAYELGAPLETYPSIVVPIRLQSTARRREGNHGHRSAG